jgi:Domain of unknown function (DUF4411)
MQVFDASSMIYAWEFYPIAQFPPLWEWMAAQIKAAELVMPSVAFEEVDSKIPDCGEWLKENGLNQLEITNAILQDAMFIKGLLGIVGDKYNDHGVGENDILIIAAARVHQTVLVSNEARQHPTPLKLERCKIPAVCGMTDVSVRCINFIEFIKNSNAVFR